MGGGPYRRVLGSGHSAIYSVIVCEWRIEWAFEHDSEMMTALSEYWLERGIESMS